MKSFKKVKLVILDEWLLTALRGAQVLDLLEIIETRHQNNSTIFCSQSSQAGWHEATGEKTLDDAILNRIVHDSYTITTDGKISMRERHVIK